jgi:peroxiredoxin
MGRKKRLRTSKKKAGESKKILIMMAVLVILLAFVGIVTYKPSQPQSSQYQLAPSFTITDITGRKVSLSDFRGKVVILDFMGSQCIPCKEQVVELRKVHQTYSSSRVETLSISVYSGEGWNEELRSFASSFDVRWRIATDTDGTVTKYQIKSIPTIMILDQNGGIRFRHEGLTDAPAIIQQIKTILGET